MKVLRLSLLIGLLSTAGFAGAAEQTPAFMQPEVLKAAIAIGLNEEQKPKFQAALGDFVNARLQAIGKLMRKRNQTGLPRKIKSKTRSLLKQMDADMAAFLTPEQMPAYENYRDTLKANLRGG
ncbi:MAG: hypothetical protein AAF529_08715 [Pseudomonadota bacterium]